MTSSTPPTDPRLLILRDEDNVCIACTDLEAGTLLTIEGSPMTLKKTIPVGHKVARQPIKKSEKVFKYGASIGSATCDILLGDDVHTHNVKSDYIASYTLDDARTNAMESDKQ